MSDPRNAAHDKKVSQEKEKKHHSDEAETTAPGEVDENATASEAPQSAPAGLEGSVKVLTLLKDMDFHSRATLERLAEMMLTVGDELKQKEFAKQVGDLFSAQDTFQSQLVDLIQAYQAEVTRMQGDSA
ncbi:hypothetical protein FEM03_06605 [Phragmitibacter flavus]|uniref:Uncharacterized protein n=1 Tax=Phragmitibacter flavus TaxID=2576071 RepID=A0A5R8KHK8_9BACT|nr:hypothetical protein [Phragmitibacter flavus]TLD71804.1 hypothetical protein FEM03_06605 [Phragmitibacter flavus]